MVGDGRRMDGLFERLQRTGGTPSEPLPMEVLQDFADGVLTEAEEAEVAGRLVDSRASRERLLRVLAADRGLRDRGGPSSAGVPGTARSWRRVALPLALAAGVALVVVLRTGTRAAPPSLRGLAAVVAEDPVPSKTLAGSALPWPPRHVRPGDHLALAGEGPVPAAWWVGMRVATGTGGRHRTTGGPSAGGAPVAALAAGREPGLALIAVTTGDPGAARGLLAELRVCPDIAAASDLASLSAVLGESLAARAVPDHVALLAIEVVP